MLLLLVKSIWDDGSRVCLCILLLISPSPPESYASMIKGVDDFGVVLIICAAVVG